MSYRLVVEMKGYKVGLKYQLDQPDPEIFSVSDFKNIEPSIEKETLKSIKIAHQKFQESISGTGSKEYYQLHDFFQKEVKFIQKSQESCCYNFWCCFCKSAEEDQVNYISDKAVKIDELSDYILKLKEKLDEALVKPRKSTKVTIPMYF